MPLLKPRTRLISFRLTEEDYEQLMSVCEAEGIRSTSDLARAAISEFLVKHNTFENCSNHTPFQICVAKVARLECEVQRLISLVEAFAVAAQKS